MQKINTAMVSKLLNLVIRHLANSLIKIVFADIVDTSSVSKTFCTTTSKPIFTRKELISVHLKYLPRFGIGRQLRLELCAVLYTAAKSKGRLFFLCIKSVLSLMEHSFNSQIHKGLFRVCPEYTINQSFIIKKIRI